jgi:hypothetical protein
MNRLSVNFSSFDEIRVMAKKLLSASPSTLNHKRRKTMNLNNFTIKAQESIQKAQEIASGMQHPQIENAHILKGVFSVDENVIPFLLKKMDVDINAINTDLEKLLQSIARKSAASRFIFRLMPTPRCKKRSAT